jgi:hypothetical protein
MSYVLALGSAASTADKATADAVKWNQAYEARAGEVDPEVVAYLALRDYVFKLADELGIGEQVRVLYHTTAVAAKGGMVGGAAGGAAYAAAEQVGSGAGSMVAAQYSGAVGTGAAIGMAAGTVVGLAVALFSIFSDDNVKAEERAKRKAERQKAQAFLLSRLSLPDLIKEQQNSASTARQRASRIRAEISKFGYLFPSSINKEVLGDPVAYDKAAAAADHMVALYQKIGQSLKSVDLKLFESMTNTQRWQTALSANDAVIQQLKALPFPVVQEGSQEFSANLRARLTTEAKVFKDLLAARQAAAPKFLVVAGKLVPKKTTKVLTGVKVPDFSKSTSPFAALFIGGLVAALGVGGYWYWRKRHAK